MMNQGMDELTRGEICTQKNEKVFWGFPLEFEYQMY